ncbi:MAG: Type 1 glutamine amidotransferase-like domain-containing protein [bacterium]|nr:Type 1 glutamine amidotransferase-like domain-containing protein [bacterium]
MASNPDNYDENKRLLHLDQQACEMSDLSFQNYMVIDHRNMKQVSEILAQASLIFLAGGNTQLQNHFFATIQLKEALHKTTAPILGISAGAMNCGEIVVNSSQKSKNPDLPLLLKGLGISKYTIIPHFEQKQNNPDELKLILEASQTTKIYALRDGSYIRNDMIYGKCELIYQGKRSLLCDE